MKTAFLSKQLLTNSRFYVLVFSFIVSIFVVALTRLNVASDQLFAIRTQQIFGLLALIYWYIALLVSPLAYVIGKQRLTYVSYARRAIGVSVFYFAGLHAAIAFYGQLGGFSGIDYLPASYQVSLLLGSVAVFVLFLMAITSFDAAIRFMTFKKWKWLQRLGYIAGVLALVHVWLVGTHVKNDTVMAFGLACVLVLLGLELYRVVTVLSRKYLQVPQATVVTIFLAVLFALSITVLLITVSIRGSDETSRVAEPYQATLS